MSCTRHLGVTNPALRCQSLKGEMEPGRRIERRISRVQTGRIASNACGAIGRDSRELIISAVVP